MDSARRATQDGNDVPVTRRLAAFARSATPETLPPEVLERARDCLADLLSCALEAASLPWGRQALEYGRMGPAGPAPVIGTRSHLAPTEAAFVNGALAHGLIREDMHVASNTHMGVVVWPTLLALAASEDVSGPAMLAAAVAGYEAGARTGRALFDPQLAARIRPTGIVGAIGGAAAGASLLGLGEDEAASAFAFAANAACGVNEWPWCSGSDVFFHAAFAARNAVTAVRLAQTGAFGSPGAIDGRAGLFAAFDRRDRASGIKPVGDGAYEIMSVYWKPAPACNFVQTPCQAAKTVAERVGDAASIREVTVRTFPAARDYPGCNQSGPFEGPLAAKMSIQFSVAATLVSGRIGEANYARLDDPDVLRLARHTSLVIDDALEAAYPARQGVEVSVTLTDGRVVTERMDDVVALDAREVTERFEASAKAVYGDTGGRRLGDILESLPRAGSTRPLLAALVLP